VLTRAPRRMGGTAMMRRFFVILLASLTVPAVIKPALADSGVPGVPAVGSSSRLTDPSDFNGDGYSDMVASAGLEDIGSLVDAGGVNVIYGSAAGLTSTGNQFWQQDSTGILGTAAASDFFGTATATGDFNGDGFSDLAIGALGDRVGTKFAGAVNVLYGSADGLSSDGNQLWTQDGAGVAGVAEAGDAFGSAVATGDFDGDGYSDLAIGAGGEDIGSIVNAGGVNVIFGSATGLRPAGNQFWSQDSTDIVGKAEKGDSLGAFSVASGDMNGDGISDLALGVHAEDIGSVVDAGGVNVIYGSSSGLTSAGNQFWSQDTTGVKGVTEAGDDFGFELVSADWGNGPQFDLAINANQESLGTLPGAGGVNVLYGSSTGLTAAGNQFWSQDSADVAGVAAANEDFGNAMAAGDFGNGPQTDLALAVGGDVLNGLSNAGSVNVLYGSPNGLTSAGNQLWNEDSADIIGTATQGDVFGWDIWQGNFGFTAEADLIIGVALKDVSTQADAGAVNAIYGTSDGLSSVDNQYWTQDSPGIAGVAETGDTFGFSMS
jgi:hypothetical protein